MNLPRQPRALIQRQREAAPHLPQTQKVNAIYRAQERGHAERIKPSCLIEVWEHLKGEFSITWRTARKHRSNAKLVAPMWERIVVDHAPAAIGNPVGIQTLEFRIACTLLGSIV